MAFWIFMLIMDMLIPAVMAGFGYLFLKRPPKEINSIYGYRTAMSMKNKDAWQFAHKYIGKLWYIGGLILVPITLIPMLFVIGKDIDLVGAVGGILCFVQMIPLIGCIVPTEKALKKNFDSEGRRKG
ncbi:MAG: SdpI family protein [Lachnospiraceae bacterium]|nr:SdpI family protein [Lachnospiraceae bacterium]